MARVDVSGAEVGSVNELNSVTIGGTGGTRTFTSIDESSPDDLVPPRGGLRSWLARQTGVTAAGSIYGTMNLTATATGCARFSVALNDEASVNGIPIISILDSVSGQAIQVWVSSVGGWQAAFVTSAGVTQGFVGRASSTAPSKWHDISLRWSIGGGTKNLWFSINGSSEGVAVAGVGLTFTSVNRFHFGIAPPPTVGTPGDGCTFQFDDIIIDNANARIDHGRFLIAMRPNSDDLKDLLIPASGTHFDDVADNADGTFVRTSLTAAQFDMFGLTDSGIDTSIPTVSRTIPTVFMSIRAGAATDSAAATDQRVGLQLSGVNSTLIQPTVSLTPTTKRAILVASLNPSGGNWSPTDLNNLKAFVGKNASTLADAYTYIEVWVTAEIAIHINSAEAITLADSVTSIKNSLALTESVSFSSIISSLTNKFEQVDVMTLVDGITSMKNNMAFAEPIVLEDAVTSIKNWLALTDTATLTDSTAVFVRVQATLSDGATLDDSISSLKASLSLIDEITEVVVVDKMAFVSILLSGGGTVKKIIFGIFD